MTKIQKALEARLSAIVLIIVAVQPVLDVLSYFLSELGSNTVSTLLRFAMLAAVALLGFVLSDKKMVYLVLYAVAGVFWTAHVLNSYRIGYTSVVQDTANFLRILNFPIFVLTFITILEINPALRDRFYFGVALNFGEMLLFTVLPWVTGHPVYTYENLEVGIMGWFAIPNAQAVILVLGAPLAIYWAYRSGKYPVFLGAMLISFGLMYATGTKFTFYSIFIIAGAYIFLFILQLGKKSLRFALPMLLLFALVFAFRHQSPMALRERMSAYSQGLYADMVEESLENSGADEDMMKILENEGEVLPEEEDEEEEQKPVPRPEKVIARMRQSIMGVYTDEDVYGWLLNNLNQRFGVYNVMEAYHHSVATGTLSDFRACKTFFARMVWHEKDTLTHWLGYEYSDFLVGGTIYDLENDFPAVYYCCGYLGFGLYLLFFAVFVFVVLRAFTGSVVLACQKEPARKHKALWAAKGCWQGLRDFLTIETGAAGMSFLLAVIAAQISGYVLRRPNVTIYFAIAAACLYSITASAPWPALALKKAFGKGKKAAANQ